MTPRKVLTRQKIRMHIRIVKCEFKIKEFWCDSNSMNKRVKDVPAPFWLYVNEGEFDTKQKPETDLKQFRNTKQIDQI